MTSNKAPAHPHATGVAMYPALFLLVFTTRNLSPGQLVKMYHVLLAFEDKKLGAKLTSTVPLMFTASPFLDQIDGNS